MPKENVLDVELVVAVAASDLVVARSAPHGVVARATVDDVGALVTTDVAIVPGVARDDVVARSPDDLVLVARAPSKVSCRHRPAP